MDASRWHRRDFTSPEVPRTHRFLSQYMDQLRDQGLSAGLISERIKTAKHFVFWLDAHALDIGAVNARTANRFLNHDCECPVPYRFRGRSDQVRGSLLYPFFRFLVEATGRAPLPAEVVTGIELLERFSQALLAQGYFPSTVWGYQGKCRHFIVWLYLNRIPISTTDENVCRRFFEHDCSCARPIFFRKPGNFNASSGDPGRIWKFIDFLAGEGVVQGNASSPRCDGPDEHLSSFLDWLRRHRGVSEQTVRNYSRQISTLLQDIGDDPAQYDAATVQDALLHRLKTVSHGQAHNLASSFRMYLRYLASAGLCPSRLVYAVPTIPDRGRIRMPRYVAGEDIERSIASCDMTTPTGVRDRAVLSVLSVSDGEALGLFDGFRWSGRARRRGFRTAVGASSRCAAPSLRYGPSGDPPPSLRPSASMAVSKLPATGRSLDGMGGRCGFRRAVVPVPVNA